MILGAAGIPLPGMTWATASTTGRAAYVAFWTAYAQMCADPANGVDTVRFAHENDGDWFHWSARGQGQAMQEAAAIWVGIMRQYAPKVKLAINPTSDASGMLDYYFGQIIGLFDIVGVDVYPWQGLVDGNSPAMTDTARQHVWAWRLSQLVTIHAWAKLHGKPVYYYEVGLREWESSGTGDDAVWVNSFFAFIEAQGIGTGPGQVCGYAWWEDPAGGGRGFFQHCIPVPNATAAFLADIKAPVGTPPVVVPPVVVAPPLTITNPSAATGDATVGQPLDATWLPVTAAGGTAPYTWSTAGMPAGMAIDAKSGAWSIGQSPAAGSDGVHPVTFTCTDAKGAVATHLVVMTIHPATVTTPVVTPPVLVPPTPPAPPTGAAVAAAVRGALTLAGV